MAKQVKTCLDKLRREEPKSRSHTSDDGETKQKWKKKGQNARLEHRVALLNTWKSFDGTRCTSEDIASVEKQMPRKAKMRRKLDDESFEEYMDYLFPGGGESAAKNLKFLQREMAHAWKAQNKTGDSEMV